jgi:predicted RNase H-like nuclease (RuvC/YqgF family)
MVVDVKVSNRSFTMRDTADICYTDTLVISPDRTAILREVEAQRANDEALIARVESVRAEIPKLDEIIDILSPEKRERKLHEERMNKMDDSINGLKESVGDIREMLEALIKQKSNGCK